MVIFGDAIRSKKVGHVVLHYASRNNHALSFLGRDWSQQLCLAL